MMSSIDGDLLERELPTFGLGRVAAYNPSSKAIAGPKPMIPVKTLIAQGFCRARTLAGNPDFE
jgi:hypothetical protein